MRLVLSLLMLGAVVAGFVIFIVPEYQNIQTLRTQEADYNQILSNARKLQTEIDRLNQRYNSFSKTDIQKLSTMIPKNPDNVKLILQLDGLSKQYGMSLQNVKIDETSLDTSTTATTRGSTPNQNPDIGNLGINFTIIGGYSGFIEFIRAMETSLRIIDINKLSFAAVDDKPFYQYTVGVTTYWLK